MLKAVVSVRKFLQLQTTLKYPIFEATQTTFG